MGGVFMESEGKKRLIRISVWVAVLSMLLAVLSSLATALEASAHATLRSMTPAAGSTVTTAPTKVVLTFNEPISANFATVTVTDATGGSVTSGRVVVDGETVTQKLGTLGSGRYTVAFRVVSEDGHPVSQKAGFTVALKAPATSTAQPTASPTPTSTPSGGSSPSATASSTPSAGSAASASTDSNGSSPALAWGLGAVVLAALAGGALAWQRGRGNGE
jgi:methionine-rich copper-binding protein CopC